MKTRSLLIQTLLISVAGLSAAVSFTPDARADQRAGGGGGAEPTFRTEIYVPIGPGRVMHVTETASAYALHRHGPRRAIVMLPGPVTQGSFFNIDVPGYDGGALLASHGFLAYAVDFEGTGQSTYPVDGCAATLQSQVEAVKAVIDHVQKTRGVHRVDLLGESWGGGVAAEVCQDPNRARSCILSSMIYANPTPMAASAYQSPGWFGFLQSLPNAYLPTAPWFYAPLTAGSPPDVQARAAATQPSLYTVEPLFEFFELPFFDPTVARVPGLVIRGENDPDSLPSDAEQLAEDYGPHGAVGMVTIPGGGHIPRIDVAPMSTAFWDTVTDFLDAP